MSVPTAIGRYRVEAVVGVGGFGSVVRAHDDELSSSVAIKILADNWSTDPDIRNRFLAEARHLRRIRNPHVVTVYDVGELDDGRPYFVMEFADRGSVADRLRTRPSGLVLDPPVIARLVAALADGVSAIHQAGLVHRDLNPRNLLVCSDLADIHHDRTDGTVVGQALLAEGERVVVGDLGLAKDLLISDGAASILGGSPHYQAPEQLNPDAGVTPSADIYALTAMLWHLLSGDVPPEANLITADELGRFEPRWRSVLRNGLAFDPEKRFSSVLEWRDAALDALGDHSGAPASAATGGSAPGAVSTRCPYRGLASYQLDDAADFFGREELVVALVDRLRDRRTLVVAGSSGSGKSSVVRAGLVRSLSIGSLPTSERWPVALMTPGADPLSELRYQLVRIASGLLGRIPDNAESERLTPTAARLIADAVTDQAGGLVLCIDQFEELFTLCPSPADRSAFIDVLAALVDPTASQVRLVLAMRADFYAQAALYPWLAHRITDNQVLVGPLERAELRRAIEGPAHRAGLMIEDGLVDAFLDDAGAEVGSLPLVSHALVETWRRRTNGRMTLAGYRDAGGVSGAISKTADALHEEFDDNDRAVMANLFLRLVNPGEGTLDTRRRVALSEIDDGAEVDVIERLVDARLVTAGDEHVELAHEALLSNWPRLRAWIEDSRADLRLRDHISRAAAAWRDGDEDPDLLYRGAPLASALEWRSGHDAQLGPLERRFLEVSETATLESAALEAQRELKTRRVRRVATAALAGVVVAAAIGVASVARVRSEERATAADERVLDNLGLVARLTADDDPYLALGLGAEARLRASGPSVDAWSSVVSARQFLAGERLVPVGEPIKIGGRALTVALSPDGDAGALGLDDGTLRLVDARTGGMVGEERRHDNGIEEISFSPDGRRLATAGVDGRVLIWEVASLQGGAAVAPVELQLGQIGWSVAWSPDGDTIATAGENGVVQLWSARTGEPDGTPLVDTAFDMLTVAFSPDGTQLISADGRGKLFAWALPNRSLLYSEVDAHAGSDIWELVFTADGTRFATVSSDKTATLRDAATGSLVEQLFTWPNGDRVVDDVHGLGVWDDSTVLGGTDRGQIVLWDLAKQRVAATAGQSVSAEILDVAYSSESGRILAVGDDETLRRWQIDRQWPLGTRTDGLVEGAYGAAFIADGSELAVGEGDGHISVIDSGTGEVLERFDIGLSGRVWGLDAVAGGERIAAGDDSGRVVIADRGTVLQSFAAHDGAVSAVRFDPDGDLVATGGADDGRLRIWRVDDANPIADVTMKSGIDGLAWAPDGMSVVVVESAGSATVVDTKGSIRAGPRSIKGDRVWSVAFAPDASMIAFGAADDTVTMWPTDLAGEPLDGVTQLGADATAISFVDEGRLLVSLTRDGSVRVWDVATADPVGESVRGHGNDDSRDKKRNESWRVAVHPDGLRFATTGTDGTVQIWDVLSLERACSVALEVVSVDQPRVLGKDGRLEGCAALTGD